MPEARHRVWLLPTPCAHVVLTIPHQLAPLTLQNKEVIHGLLFDASAQTLIEIASDRRHLGAEISFFSVLHTWNQKLQYHPHVHCVVAAGGLPADRTQWIQPRSPHFFLPKDVLSEDSASKPPRPRVSRHLSLSVAAVLPIRSESISEGISRGVTASSS